MIRELFRALALTGPLEAAAVMLGLVYVLLIMKRNRLGWIAGGISSAIYVYLFASARLPLQSALQIYYVIMAVYGWVSWTRAQQQDGGRVVRWPLSRHAAGLLGVALISLLSARFLASETHDAWPYLDSLTTCASLLATWMAARLKLENWLYWIGIDAITAWLLAAQDHLASAALYLVFTVIAALGFREWLLRYRQATA